MTTHIFFDIDGTLTNGISSWKQIHDTIGSKAEARVNHKDWIVHQDARKWVDSDIALLNKYNVTPTRIDEILGLPKIEYMINAREQIVELQQIIDMWDVQIHLLSGAVYPYAEAVGMDLFIHPDYWHFHKLDRVKVYGNYSSYDMKWKHDRSNTFENKGVILNGYKARENKLIAVGNGTNDIEMFQRADIAIGINIRKQDRNKIEPHLDVRFFNQEGVFPKTLIDYLMGVIDV